MLQYRLQYEAPGKLRSLYRTLAFYLQIYIFLSGAEGIRTPDLRLAKADQSILECSSLSGIFDVLQAFCSATGSALSSAYRLVPSRLQYGCSKQYCLSSEFEDAGK